MRNIQLVASQKGRTLLEILVSIVILSIVSVSLATVFVQAVRSMNTTEQLLDATYVAQTTMEEIYYRSTQESLPTDEHYSLTAEAYLVAITLTRDSDRIVNVLVEVYDNSTRSRKEAQMETYILWEK
nr:type II secretion system protein [Evansella caseinilytica]